MVDAEGLDAWLAEHGVRRDQPLVLAVGGAVGLAARLHELSGLDVVAPSGLWSVDGSGGILTTRGEGPGPGPATWTRFRSGRPPQDLGPRLTPALAAAGHPAVPAPAAPVPPAPDAALPSTSPLPAQARLGDLTRAVLAEDAAADLRAGRGPELLVPVPVAPRTATDDRADDGTVFEDALSDPGSDTEVFHDAPTRPGVPAAVVDTPSGHVLGSAALTPAAVRYAGRLPQVSGWTVLVAAATARGGLLLDGDVLDVDGLAGLLDRLGVPPGAPVAVVAPAVPALLAELSRRTGRVVVGTAGPVELGPDGRAAAFAAATGPPPARGWWQAHLPDLTTQPLDHEFTDAMARFGTVTGPMRGPVDRALADLAAAVDGSGSEPGSDSDSDPDSESDGGRTGRVRPRPGPTASWPSTATPPPRCTAGSPRSRPSRSRSRTSAPSCTRPTCCPTRPPRWRWSRGRSSSAAGGPACATRCCCRWTCA